MKKTLILTLLLSVATVMGYGQNVVKSLSNVKKPKNGKLFFEEKSSRLVIYLNGSYFTILQGSDAGPGEDEKPEPETPAEAETIIGHWKDPDKILVLYPIKGNLWLMQKDPSETYYIPRGKNLISDPLSKITADISKVKIAGEDTPVGGLYAPSGFPEADFAALTGRVKQANGEYTLNKVEPPGSGGGISKIKQPVGVIMWSGFFTTLSPDDPIDITKETRYALSLPQTVNQAPFYSEYHSPEILQKQHWNNATKQWEWSPVTVTVRFNGDRPGVIEKQVDYAVSAGIDYFLFNYYATGATPMAIERMQFEALPDKKGLKGAYIMENIGGDPDREARLIAAAFRQDWYQKIDGKPLLVLPASGSADFDRVYGIFQRIKSAYGGEIYTILQAMEYPVNAAGEIRKRGYNSHSRYSTWGGWNQGDHSHRFIMDAEWQWYQDSKNQTVDFTPNLTTSFYQYGALASWGEYPNNFAEKATDAEVHEQWRRLAEYVNNNPQVKTVYAYSWNEFSEGGRAICPQLNSNGTVDDRVLRIITQYVD